MEHTKESALETAISHLREALEDDNNEVCLIIGNTETGNLRIMGMNMPEEDVPLLLTAAAEEMADAVLTQYDNRTIN